VVAGHSRGGIVIGAAAEADPAAIDALAYIAALMPPNGQTSYSLQEAAPDDQEMGGLGGPVANGAGLMVDPVKARPYFAQLAPPHLAEAAMLRLMAEPVGPLSTPMQITPERWGSVPRTYIECLQDRTITIAHQRKMQELSPGTRRVTLYADHSPMFCAPEALADALEDVAR
jgi:pimeloyl-ACP methyl ester carboxylesterase